MDGSYKLAGVRGGPVRALSAIQASGAAARLRRSTRQRELAESLLRCDRLGPGQGRSSSKAPHCGAHSTASRWRRSLRMVMAGGLRPFGQHHLNDPNRSGLGSLRDL
jgi:hypothetical protein